MKANINRTDLVLALKLAETELEIELKELDQKINDEREVAILKYVFEKGWIREKAATKYDSNKKNLLTEPTQADKSRSKCKYELDMVRDMQKATNSSKIYDITLNLPELLLLSPYLGELPTG